MELTAAVLCVVTALINLIMMTYRLGLYAKVSTAVYPGQEEQEQVTVRGELTLLIETRTKGDTRTKDSDQ